MMSMHFTDKLPPFKVRIIVSVGHATHIDRHGTKTIELSINVIYTWNT